MFYKLTPFFWFFLPFRRKICRIIILFEHFEPSINCVCWIKNHKIGDLCCWHFIWKVTYLICDEITNFSHLLRQNLKTSVEGIKMIRVNWYFIWTQHVICVSLGCQASCFYLFLMWQMHQCPISTPPKIKNCVSRIFTIVLTKFDLLMHVLIILLSWLVKNFWKFRIPNFGIGHWICFVEQDDILFW